ncbi:MAG: hypothetical protein NTV51_01445 [Verrucomicrobia bacterium]|nr:hypothetical protein [Verrucomicrobiota bacterium]
MTTNFLRTWKLFAVLLLCHVARLPAQELTFLGGVMKPSSLGESGYAWQVDYQQNFYRNFSGSIAYINEGHVTGHHRDGTAWQLWGRLPLFDNKIAISLGAGAYYFFDTQPLSGGDTANVHGTAPIYSLAATGYLSNRWFYRAQVNQISPAREMKTTTAAIGAGFWFGRDKKPTPGKLGDAPDEKGYVTENEFTLFAGQSVVNTFLSQQALAYAVEYRRGLIPHLDWTASGIYEGDPEIIRRNGVATQLWAVNTFFDDRIAVGAGLGPYVYLDHKHPASAGKKNPAAIAPLASLTFSVRLSEHWIMRLVFDRVTSSYNRDADIFLAGLGYRWPR